MRKYGGSNIAGPAWPPDTGTQRAPAAGGREAQVLSDHGILMKIALFPILCLCIAALGAGRSFAQAPPGWQIRGGYQAPGPILLPPYCYSGRIACVDLAGGQARSARQRRFDALRHAPAVDHAPAATGLWIVPPFAYLPPPTPEDQIQPAYRDHSVIRPEFRNSGQPIQ